MKWVLLLCLLLVSGCADSVSLDAAKNVSPVGFWHGLWHGMILPVAWIISLFNDGTAIYAIYNNGGWYDFGFFMGVCSLGGSSNSAARSHR